MSAARAKLILVEQLPDGDVVHRVWPLLEPGRRRVVRYLRAEFGEPETDVRVPARTLRQMDDAFTGDFEVYGRVADEEPS